MPFGFPFLMSYDEHMDPIFILGAIAGAPVLLALVFRVSAIYLFLSAVAGSLFVTYVADDASFVVEMAAKGGNIPTITKFALLFVPIVVTLLFMRKTLPRSKLLFHILPLLATGLAIGMFALPLFSGDFQHQIYDKQPYGTVIKDAQDVVISGAAFLVLLLVWITKRDKPDKKHGKHK